jgi:hypothetical protein
MRRLRMLGIAMFVAFPFLTSATQISGLGDTASVPSALLITTWARSLDFQWSMPPVSSVPIADETINIDTQGYGSPLVPGLFSIGLTAGETTTGAVSILGESEPGSRLTLAILIFIALAALLKGFPTPSPAFSGFGEHLTLERRADSTVLGLVSILYSMAVFFLKLRKA